MSRSLNTKANSIGKSVDERKERYDKKHAIKPRGQSGTHRIKNLNNTSNDISNNEIENTKNSQSIFSKIISRFR